MVSQNKKLQPLVAEISWTKNILILTKCKDPLEREFYMLHVRKFGWTKDVLIHQIENKTYEKYLMNQTNFDQTLPEKYKHQAKLAVKDHYTFDFLELAEEHREQELEQTLVKNIRSKQPLSRLTWQLTALRLTCRKNTANICLRRK